jgi:hypothetical protein
MADQGIADYIRENLGKGVKPDDIRVALLDSGWPAADIDAGMAQAGAGGAVPAGMSPLPPPGMGGKADKPKKKGHKKLIILLIVLIILVFVFLTVAANIVKTFSDMFPGSMDSINGILGGGGS